MSMHTELTLDEAMADPMILLVMQADHVDPTKLRRAWAPLITKLRAEANADEVGPDDDTQHDAPVLWRNLVGDCIHSAWSTAAKPKAKAGLR